MADILNVTPPGIPTTVIMDSTVTSQNFVQNINQSPEISAYDELDLMILLAGVTGNVNLVKINFLTSMQIQDDDSSKTTGSWVPLMSSATTLTEGEWKQIVLPAFPYGASTVQLLRYLRWQLEVTASASGGNNKVLFQVTGMARRRAAF